MPTLNLLRPGVAELDIRDAFPRIRREPHRPQEEVSAADPLEQMAEADRADWALMRLVLCAAVATLLLAVAGSLHV